MSTRSRSKVNQGPTAVEGKCFICAKLTEQGEILNQNESAIVLQEILGLPKSHATRSIVEQFQKVCYCPDCLQRLRNIQLWTTTQHPKLEETLKKEQKMLWKDLVGNCTQVKSKTKNQYPLGMLQLLRNEIVAQIRKCERSRRELDEILHSQTKSAHNSIFDPGDNSTFRLATQNKETDDEYEDQYPNDSTRFNSKNSSTKTHPSSQMYSVSDDEVKKPIKILNLRSEDEISNLNFERKSEDVEMDHCSDSLPSTDTFVGDPKEEIFIPRNVRKKKKCQNDKVLKSFNCGVCDKIFPNQSALNLHGWSTHRKDGKFPCLKCNFTGKRLSDLGRHHVRIHSQQKNFKCDECEASFKDKYDLASHKKIHSGSGPYKCKWCSARFSNFAHLRRHEGVGHSSKKCAQPKYKDVDGKAETFSNEENSSCSSEAKEEVLTPISQEAVWEKQMSMFIDPGDNSASGLVALKKEVEDEYENQSQNKPTKFKKKRSSPRIRLRRKINQISPISEEEGQGQLIELVNVKNENEVSKLRRESVEEKIEQHPDDLPSYSSVESIDAPTEEIFVPHNVARSKPSKCGLCDKSYPNQKALKIHILSIHRKDGVFVCLECDYSSKNMFDISRHFARRHSKQRNFKCDECEASFKDRYYLVEHRKIHDRTGLYKCKWCSARFDRFEQVKRHEGLGHKNAKSTQQNGRISSNELSSSDSDSDSSISIAPVPKEETQSSAPINDNKKNILRKQKVNVKVLESKPENPKSFKCKGCDKVHSSPDELKVHILSIHHKNGKFACLECDYTSKLMYDLGRHYSRRHSQSQQQNFDCKECDASFKDPLYLHKHKKIHARSGLYKCKFCSATFNEMTTVTLHEKQGHPNKNEQSPKSKKRKRKTRTVTPSDSD